MVTIGDLENNEIESIHIEGITNIPLIKGEQGEKGDKGDKGETNNIKIGTVETGEKASATLEGESPNQILNLVLPKGDKGEQGEPGIKPVKGIDYFTKEEIQKIKSNILDQVNQFSVLVVEELPTDNIDEHTIYFVPKTKTEQNDVYDEFIYINNGWEHIGTTEVDLSSYYKKDEIDTKLEAVEGNEVFVGNEEEAPSSAKIIIEDEDFEESLTLGKAEVYVGAEEPTAGEKVWFRKGKNYLDISKLGTRTSYGITFTPTNTGIKITGTATDTYAYGTSIKIDLKKGKTYTLYGKNAGNTLKIELKKTGTSVMSIKTSGDKVTFTTSEDIDSITFILEGITKGTTYDYEITNIQIEPGSSAKPYEAYVEPQIYVRNSNGVYEEFIKKSEEVYSTEEQVIGTWIDGKPLYRKVVEMGNMTKDNYKMKAHNIQNMKYARIVDVSMQRGNQSSGNFQLFSVGNVGGKYNDTQVGFDTYIDSNCVYVYCNGDRTLFVGTAIIEYTKTTD